MIKENVDFADHVNPPNSNISTDPNFRIVQSKNPKYVFVMDVSTSMETPACIPGCADLIGVRSENLKSAVKRWVTFEVADGTEVALVVFSNVVPTYNPVIFNMSAVNNETRAEMIEAVDNRHYRTLRTCKAQLGMVTTITNIFHNPTFVFKINV